MAEHIAPNQGSPRRKTSSPQRRLRIMPETEQSALVNDAARKNDHAYLNTSQTGSVRSAPSSSSFVGTRMTLRYHRRNSDHMYMAKRRAESSVEPPKKKRKTKIRKLKVAKRPPPTLEVASQHTDHQYNVSATSKSNSRRMMRVVKVNNRDSDHMYNIRNSATVPLLSSSASSHHQTSAADNGASSSNHSASNSNHGASSSNHSASSSNHSSSNSKNGASSSNYSASSSNHSASNSNSADKRVVDKDHMYQHNTRKERNKGELKGAAVKKCRKLTDKTLVNKVNAKKQQAVAQPQGLDKSKPNEEMNKLPSVSATEPEVKSEDFPTDHDYLRVLSKDVSVSDGPASSVKEESSPARSDFSDNICDDSRRTVNFQYDHMYVYPADNDMLDDGVNQPGTPCFHPEGYREEHSYANSEETRYDACKNCSELVQQLIGTINQQKIRIEELTRQLDNAKTQNEQLQMMLIFD